MREILFRGQKAIYGGWVYGSLAVKTDSLLGIKTYFILNQEPRKDGLLEPLVSWHNVKPETVGQYTGLKDKNGKRIFEGDICRNTRTDEIVSVKWHGTMAGYVWSKRKENSHLYDFGELFRAYDKYEVIGNIHDNPELMKGE